MTEAVPETSLETYKQMFRESRDLTAEARKQAQIDDDYYHGYQLSSEERATLQKRGQPDTTFNRVRVSINGTLGVIQGHDTDPIAYPRNPQDEDSATVATKVLRFIADQSDFHRTRVEGAYQYFAMGTVAAIVEAEGGTSIPIGLIHYDELVYDPRSRRHDFSDARYLGVAKWMYLDDLVHAHPDKKVELEQSLTAGDMIIEQTLEQRPSDVPSQWADQKQRRLLCVELYHRKGQDWYRCKFVSGCVLEKGPSPYMEKVRGKMVTVCPIVAQSCYIDRENNRYGIIRDQRSPQDEFNKRRQKLLHLLNNRQMRAENPDVAMMQDTDTVRAESARADGVLPPGWGPVSLTDMSQGQFNLLTMAEKELERMGPNPAVLGRQNEEASGRAQLVRQQAGMTELGPVFGGHEAWEKRIYKSMWARAQQFMKGPDFIRVTDDQNSPEFVGINMPVMGPPAVVPHPETGMPMVAPQQVGTQNELAAMDVDITVDTVPHTATLDNETFQGLGDVAKSGQLQLPPEVWLELAPIPNKKRIKELMQTAQAKQQPDPIQQAQAQLALRTGHAEAGEKESKAQLNAAKAAATAHKIGLDEAKTDLAHTQSRVSQEDLQLRAIQAGHQAGHQAA